MWEKGTGFTFRPPFLWRSLFIWVCCSACDDLRPFLLMLSTGNKPSSHSVLLSSISLFIFSLSLYLQDQSDKSKSDDDWGHEDIVFHRYIQKDYIFHNCCSGSYSVVFFLYIYLSSWTVYCHPFTHQLENILLIIDKLQQYQYHICLYSRFKDNFVVKKNFKFQIWMKKEKKKIWSCYTHFCFLCTCLHF